MNVRGMPADALFVATAGEPPVPTVGGLLVATEVVPPARDDVPGVPGAGALPDAREIAVGGLSTWLHAARTALAMLAAVYPRNTRRSWRSG